MRTASSRKQVRLAAAQPLSSKARVMQRHRNDPVARNEHFRRYNIGAATYDEAYARRYGEEYLLYLETWVRQAAERDADLLLFPEFCFVPGVLAAPGKGAASNRRAFADALRLYTWSGRLFSDWLRSWSRRTGMLIGAATYTARGGKIYNTGLLADESGRIALRYDKIHLPWDEAVHVTPGREYTVAATRVGRVGFAICYDILFPEAAACLSVRGAQIILHPSGGHTLPDEQPDMGRNRLRVRASDQFAALAYASFSPVESGGPGGTCVVARNGDVLDAVPGTRCALAVGDAGVGGKRAWPNDKPDGPDWDAVRRRCRHPETYGVLRRNGWRGNG